VEFIYAAEYLKEFGLHKDLDVYKALLNVFPKGPLIPTNAVQVGQWVHLCSVQAVGLVSRVGWGF
jgi:Evolutionarily conserved signalling intermediate in Toll pathway